jgi:hypothetical protein
MAEHYENYHKNDTVLPFYVLNPDGTRMTGIDKNGNRIDLVRMLTPDEVKGIKGMGNDVEAVKPKPFNSHAELSQTTHDQEKSL